MPKRRVALIEFSIYDQFPLVSGYLHAYAGADPVIAEAFDFIYYSKEVERCEYDETLNAIRSLRAQVLSFSCYVWNMGLVKRLVRDLQCDAGVERIILGGHQVAHHIQRYVDRAAHNVVVINGQGEIPFRAVLQRLTDAGDLTGLRGASFYTDGELWNGGEAEMLSQLDDIPSPFLGGYFDLEAHPITIFETNRGCPYTCSFCTWGGDTTKVTKFSLDRIKEELVWIARRQVPFIYLADANWGMLPRDVEISAFIGRLKKECGFPLMVYYAAAKNKPAGSIECIEKLHEGGVITSQALGVQSLNTDTLARIDRKNIRNEAYIQMFQELKARKIDSYGELIWPLPGETLDTLKAGFEQLLELGAPTVVMYPTLLINNARLTNQAAEHRIEGLASDDWKSELQIIKKTKWADAAAVDDGFWFYYAYFVLANCDRDKALLRFLRNATGKRYATIVSEFAEYLHAHADQSAYGRLVRWIFERDAHGALTTIGRLAVHLTHLERLAAQCDVATFIAAQLAGDPARSIALSILWALSLPKLFDGSRDDEEGLISHLDDLGRSDGATVAQLATIEKHESAIELHVRHAPETWHEVAACFADSRPPEPMRRIEIRHPRVGFPYLPRDENRNYVYAHGMIQRLRHISPTITAS